MKRQCQTSFFGNEWNLKILEKTLKKAQVIFKVCACFLKVSEQHLILNDFRLAKTFCQTYKKPVTLCYYHHYYYNYSCAFVVSSLIGLCKLAFCCHHYMSLPLVIVTRSRFPTTKSVEYVVVELFQLTHSIDWASDSSYMFQITCFTHDIHHPIDWLEVTQIRLDSKTHITI